MTVSASPLHRMIKLASASEKPEPPANGLAGVLTKSAAVAGLASLEVQLEARGHSLPDINPADFVQAMPENRLAFQIKCESQELIGLVVIDMDLVNAINCVLTGSINDHPDESRERRATHVDIALCQPYFDTLLLEFAKLLTELRDGATTDTYQTTHVLPEPSPHQFPEGKYTSIVLEFDIGERAKLGSLMVLMPMENTDFLTANPTTGMDPTNWASTMKNTLDAAPVSLEVVLHRLKMQIGSVMRLKVGDIINIPANALETLSIEAKKGSTQRSLMRARLGEVQEMRAAKITSLGDIPAPLNTIAQIEHDADA